MIFRTNLFRMFLLSFISTTFCLIAQDSDNEERSCNDPHAHPCTEAADIYREANPEIYNPSCWYATDPGTDSQYACSHNLWGVFLPEGPPLFRPLMADPHQLTYSVGWRFHDKLFGSNIIDVSFYDRFPVFRWCDVWLEGAELQLEIEGDVWAIFKPFKPSSPLIDADYYVGFPLTWAYGDWAVRLRGYHISTHLGDEFLVNHRHFDRLNPSIEAFDIYVSNQFTNDIRLYGGLGFVACQDDSFRVGKFYAAAGMELRLFEWGYYDYCNRIYGVPIFGMHFYYQSHFKSHVDNTYVLGYEWGKLSGLRHRFRLYLEYHDGYCMEGQFSKYTDRYLSFRASYGY